MIKTYATHILLSILLLSGCSTVSKKEKATTEKEKSQPAIYTLDKKAAIPTSPTTPSAPQ